MVEQVPVKDKVRGSNPLGGAELLIVAQWPACRSYRFSDCGQVEQVPVKDKVRGSNPLGGAEHVLL